MRKLTMAAGVAVILLASPAAGAEDAMGTIASINGQAQTITLVDGTTYVLPPSSNSSQFKIGQRVIITFEQGPDGVRLATAIASHL